MVTIEEIGIDQIIVDEAQEFRKLTFATNQREPEGRRSGRLAASLGPVRQGALHRQQATRPRADPGVGHADHQHARRDVSPCCASRTRRRCASAACMSSTPGRRAFGDTRTELELQPSGTYKPVERFAAFVNVPELIDMFRAVADVVLKDDLRQYLRLPRITRRPAPADHRRGERGLPRLPGHPRRADRGDRGAHAAGCRRATTSCSRSSPTAATPRSTCAWSGLATTTSRTTSSTG